MRTVKVIALVAALGFLGCSLKQDPLADKADIIRDAQKPAPPAQKPAPIDSQALMIDAPSHIGVVEGSAAHITITSRINLADYDFSELVIENAENFPGGKFDTATHQFNWTPALGTSGDDVGRQMYLNVRANAKSSKDKTPLTRTAVISVLVIKNPQEPLVSIIQGIPSLLREDAGYRFDVYVTDLDSQGIKANAPALTFLARSSSTLSLASFITINYLDYDPGTSQWRFSCYMKVDTNVTNSSDWAGFKVRAFSHFGKSSQDASYEGKIYTSLQRVESTWEDGLILKPQVENKVKFIVYDPRAEGVLALSGDDQTLPSGALLGCETNYNRTLTCEFTYTPAGEVGNETDGNIKFVVTSKNTDTTDSNTVKTSFSLNFKVEALPLPPPPPTPPPTPTPTPEPAQKLNAAQLIRGKK